MLHILYIAKSSSTAIIKAWNTAIGKPDQEEPDQNANESDQPKRQGILLAFKHNRGIKANNESP